jgi:hypothetical protein
MVEEPVRALLIAAEKCGVACYALDVEPSCCAVVLQRMADLGLTPRLVEAAKTS